MRAGSCAAASAAMDGRPNRPPAARRPRCPLHARARGAVSSRQRVPLAARAIAFAAAAGVQPNDEDGAEDSDAERLGADFRRMQRLAAQAGACCRRTAGEAPPPSPSQPLCALVAADLACRADDPDARANLAPPPAAAPIGASIAACGAPRTADR